MKWINLFRKFWFSKNVTLLIPFLLIFIFLILIPTIFIIIFAFTPVNASSGIRDNFSAVNSFIWWKILNSFWMALVTVIICILISYPLCYFLSTAKNLIFRSTLILLLSAPMWCSLLVKLIGIKSFFDIINGCSNSTYGNIYSIIGMIYIYIPFMLLSLYSCLTVMPKSLILASQDLGYNMIRTFFKIVIPYTKVALLSGSALVFLPCFTTVAIPQFLNNNNNSESIGDLIFEIGGAGVSNRVDLVIASAISLIVITVAFLFLFFLRVVPFIFTHFHIKKWQKIVLQLFKKRINFWFKVKK